MSLVGMAAAVVTSEPQVPVHVLQMLSRRCSFGLHPGLLHSYK